MPGVVHSVEAAQRATRLGRALLLPARLVLVHGGARAALAPARTLTHLVALEVLRPASL